MANRKNTPRTASTDASTQLPVGAVRDGDGSETICERTAGNGPMTTLASAGGRPTVRHVLAFLALAVLLASGMTALRRGPGELAISTKAAARMAAGEEFYRPEEGQAFTYPPFFALPFVPLSQLNEPVARSIWYFLNFTMLGAIAWMVFRRVWPVIRRGQGALRPPGWLYLLIVGVLSLRYVISPLEYQSHDLVVFLLAVLAVVSWDAKQRWLPGAWAGLGAACKATPLLFLVVFLAQRRLAAIFGLIVAVVGATLLPDVLFPRSDGGLWAMSWYEHFISKVGVGRAADAPGAWGSWNFLNQSLAGTLHRLSTPVANETAFVFDVSFWRPDATSLKLFTTAMQLAVVGFLAFLTWPTRSRGLPDNERRFHRLGEGAAVMCGMLLLSPMSSKQHFCTLFVPIAFCAADYLYRRRSAAVGAALTTVFVLGTLGAKDLVGRPVGNRLLAYGSLTFCTVACLLATGYVLVTRSREARQSERTVPAKPGQSDRKDASPTPPIADAA